MSPMFGRKDQQKPDKQEGIEQWRRAMQMEFERLNSLPMMELAAEVMVKGFGPGGPGADDDAISLGQQNVDAGPTAPQIALEFAPSRQGLGTPTADDLTLEERIAKLVAEGLQALEHASLVRVQMHTAMGNLDWAATRRGRAALERNEVESILRAMNAQSD